MLYLSLLLCQFYLFSFEQKVLPNYHLLKPFNETNEAVLSYLTKHSPQVRRGSYNSFTDISFFTFYQQQPSYKIYLYRYLFRNTFPNEYRFIQYPYKITFNKHLYPRGGFFDHQKRLGIHTNPQFYQSQALYGINIGIMRLEIIHNGRYKDLFYASDTFCRMTVTNIGYWGKECIETGKIDVTKNHVVYINESLDVIGLMDMVVFPDIMMGNENEIVDVLGVSGVKRIKEYINDGGFVLFDAKAGVLVEKMGLIKENSVDTNRFLRSHTNKALTKGCEMQSESNGADWGAYIKEVICSTLDKNEIFLLSSYMYNDVDDMEVLLEFDVQNLTVNNVDNPYSRPLKETDKKPLLLHKKYGKGDILILNANPSYNSHYFEWFYNILFVAMSKNFAYKQNVDYKNGMAIPAMESGIQLTLNSTFYNLFNNELRDFEMFFWIPQDVQIISKVTDAKRCELKNDLEIPHEGLNENYYYCIWETVQKFSQLKFNIKVELLTYKVTQKKTNVVLAYTRVQYLNMRTKILEKFEVGDLVTNTKVAALLRCNLNPDPMGFYPLHGVGDMIDDVLVCENKEEEIAHDVEYIAIVPIITPLADSTDQTVIIDVITFWNEYYEKTTNQVDDYIYPFKTAITDYDYIDMHFLANKGTKLNADWDTPVFPVKEDRDTRFPLESHSDEAKDIPNAGYSTNVNNGIVLKQEYLPNADSFFQHATQRLLVFVDTTTDKGSKAKYSSTYPSIVNDPRIDTSMVHPSNTAVTKTELMFARSDIFFWNNAYNKQYMIPDGVEGSHVISIDRYPDDGDCVDGFPKRILKQGYFDHTKPNGLLANEYGNRMRKECSKDFVHYDDIETVFTRGSVKKTRYLWPINNDGIQSPEDLMNFDPNTGELIDYPEVKFLYAYRFTVFLSPAITRRGGYFEFTFPYNFNGNKDNIFYSADHVAFYNTSVIGNRVISKFKRGLMPNENWGKDSIITVITENLQTSVSDFDIDIKIYELKFDISQTDNEEYYYRETRNLECKRDKFFSLPAVRLNFKLNRSGDTSMKPYELIEPLARYGVYYQEILKHRTVWGIGESHLPSDPGLVSSHAVFSVISQIGISSIPFIDYLTVGKGQVIPAGTETSRVEWRDYWSRKFSQPVRTIFPDIPPVPPPIRNFMMTSTFELTRKGTNERVLEWYSVEQLDIVVKMKLKNNYPKYFTITTCEDNQILKIKTDVSGRVFDDPPSCGSTTYPDFENGLCSYVNQVRNVSNDREYLDIGHRAFYGSCFDSGRVVLEGETITDFTQMKDVFDCWQNDPNRENCVEVAKGMKTVHRLPLDSSKKGKDYNFAEEIDNYYPKNYIKDNMWDMTHYDYDDSAFDKAYGYHMDNNLPNLDTNLIKPHNIIAYPIWKGYGFQIIYDKEYSVKKHPGYKGWYGENLQNKDDTVLFGSQSHSNTISIDKEYDDIIKADDWIEYSDLEDTQTGKYDRVTSVYKNIYSCLFNRHRIKMSIPTKNSHVANIYQNNVIPIIPDLSRYDKRYINYECDLNKEQYTPHTISQVDNRVYTPDARDWLYFASSLRGNSKEAFNVFTRLIPFNDRKFEGDTKVNDGGRFVYWNPCCGPNSFLIVDNPVNVVKSFRCDLSYNIELFPKDTSTFFSEVYHLIEIQDEEEIDREYESPIYINHYGFGDVSTSVYVGGTMGSSAIIQPGQTTYFKITIYNNAGYDFNMFGDAMDWKDLGLRIPISSYDLMKNIIRTIQVPLVYNFLIVEVPDEIKDYIEYIIPSDHNAAVAPVFFDFQFINVVSINDGFKGEYFFKMKLKNVAIPDSIRGRLHQINISLNETYFDHLPGHNDLVDHDYHIKIPPIKFGIPYSTNVDEDYQGKVYHTLGKSNDLRWTIPLFQEFKVDDIRFIDESRIDDLRTAAVTGELRKTKLREFYDTLSQDIFINHTYTGKLNEIYDVYEFDVKDYFDVFPKRTDPLKPPQASMFLLLKTSADEVPYGSTKLDYYPKLEYNSCMRRQASTYLKTYPLYRTIYAQGPYLEATYFGKLLDREVAHDKSIKNINQNLYPLERGTMNVVILLRNVGSEIAYNVKVKWYFQKDITVLIDKFEEKYNKHKVYKDKKNPEITVVEFDTQEFILAPYDPYFYVIPIRYHPEKNCEGKTVEEMPNHRVFIQQATGYVDLTETKGENTVTQKLDHFQMDYAPRFADSVDLKAFGRNGVECTIFLNATANYVVVDGEDIIYNFYIKNNNTDRGVYKFLVRSDNHLVKVNYKCGAFVLDYKVVTQHRVTEVPLAEGKDLVVIVPWGLILAVIAGGCLSTFFVIVFVAFVTCLCTKAPLSEEELGVLKKMRVAWREFRERKPSLLKQVDYYINGRFVKVKDDKNDYKNFRKPFPNEIREYLLLKDEDEDEGIAKGNIRHITKKAKPVKSNIELVEHEYEVPYTTFRGVKPKKKEIVLSKKLPIPPPTKELPRKVPKRQLPVNDFNDVYCID